MVSVRMGLLDDAIRDHLELKRRSGADPGEVAREQHEALDPVERAPDALVADDELLDAVADVAPPAQHADPAMEQPELGVMAGGVAEDMPDDLADDPAQGADGGDETAELDMRTVFDDDHATPGVAGGIRPDGERETPADPRAGDDESLEWEMPGEDAPAPEEAEPDPDVLEETPDFLRETPEHERLWFEQQPPRDFDFDN